MGALQGKKVILAVTGGIAAYKTADLCSQLRKAGAEVRVAMTASACRFVGPLTFETLSQYPVYHSIFDQPRAWEMEHISWSKWADLMLVAPASANTLAKMATGLADDPVSTLYLSFPGTVVVAPAMNTQMLEHAATQNNLATLRKRGVVIIEPESGLLACGDVGAGRLAAVSEIMELLGGIEFGANGKAAAHSTETVKAPDNDEGESAARISPHQYRATELLDRDDTLAGKTVVITSGPTHEYLDPVRFLTNPSSGKMGAALAREAARRGATVHLVSGPVSASSLPQDAAHIHRVTTAEQMLRAVRRLADQADIFVFAAAVSDFRVANPPTQKIKRTGNTLALPLIENPDIAQAIGFTKRPGQITVGFAAETQDLEANATGKMERKHLDAVVANDVSNRSIGFHRDENEVTIYLRNGETVHVTKRPKGDVAREVFAAILPLVAQARA